jgi:hypothetical protein
MTIDPSDEDFQKWLIGNAMAVDMTKRGSRIGPFHPDLITWIGEIKYDFKERLGTIIAGGPVCMSGSIELFEHIDPGVRIVLAFLNGKPDVMYRRKAGKWEVCDLRRSNQIEREKS